MSFRNIDFFQVDTVLVETTLVVVFRIDLWPISLEFIQIMVLLFLRIVEVLEFLHFVIEFELINSDAEFDFIIF